jgi:hypothetical protein
VTRRQGATAGRCLVEQPLGGGEVAAEPQRELGRLRLLALNASVRQGAQLLAEPLRDELVA